MRYRGAQADNDPNFKVVMIQMPRLFPSHLRVVDLRLRIVEHADAIFATRGYAGLNMELLSQRVGIVVRRPQRWVRPRSRARAGRLAMALLLCALGAATPAAAQETQARRKMTLEDTFRLVVPGAPSVSPDGAWVLCGASNYDDAWMQGVRFDVGGGDLQDCLSGVDALIARKIADPKRLALDGWSYGGVLGGVMLTRTPRFKAASLGAMVSDWTAEYGTGAVDMEKWFIGGNPWTNPRGWRERSSFTRADRVRTPTLLHHGAADDTCSPFQSLNYYAALRRVGTPVRLMRYGNEGHDLRQPRHLFLRDLHDVAWMQRHVNGIKSEQNPD